MKKIILITLLIVLLTTPVLALDEAFYVDLSLERSKWGIIPEKIIVEDFSIRMDFFKEKVYGEQYPETYTFVLLDDSAQQLSKTYTQISFINDHTGIISDTASYTINIPYNEKAVFLDIYNQGKLLTKYKIPNLCNNNYLCDGKENYYSCPTDCDTYAVDNLCIGIHDGKCDPDCNLEEDLDCTCGNNVCDPLEDTYSCATDCGIFDIDVVENLKYETQKKEIEKIKTTKEEIKFTETLAGKKIVEEKKLPSKKIKKKSTLSSTTYLVIVFLIALLILIIVPIVFLVRRKKNKQNINLTTQLTINRCNK